MNKPIVFGFKNKKASVLKPPLVTQIKENVRDFITSIEEKTIQSTSSNGNSVRKLVIPLSKAQKATPLDKFIENKNKNEKPIKSEPQDSNDDNNPLVRPETIKIKTEIKQELLDSETLDQRAAREIVESLKNELVRDDTKIHKLPLKPDELPLEGAKESTYDDYENVPVQDFGMAMLRGMGLKDEDIKKEKEREEIKMRPKGLGLGADSLLKPQELLVKPSAGEKLEIKRDAKIKILAGQHKNKYGTISGFQEHGRLVIKLAIGGESLTMMQHFVQPVAIKEFEQYGKVLNTEKYKEVKNGQSNATNKSESTDRSNRLNSHKSRSDRRSRSHSPRRHKDRSRRSSSESSTDYRRSKSSHKKSSKHSSRDESTSNKKYRSRRSDSDSDQYRKKFSHRRERNDRDSSSEEYSRKHKKKTKKSKKHRSRS